MLYPFSKMNKRAADILNDEEWKNIEASLSDEPALYSKLRRLQRSERAGWSNADRNFNDYQRAAADRDSLKIERRALHNENVKLSDKNRHFRDAATRYAVWGGAGLGGGALVGLAYSLINKKQRENKLRNALLGGLIGGVLGLGAAEYARWKYGEPSPIDFKGADLLN